MTAAASIGWLLRLGEGREEAVKPGCRFREGSGAENGEPQVRSRPRS